MEAKDVQKLERRVGRDIQLVVAGFVIGVATGLLIMGGITAVGLVLLAAGILTLMALVWSKP
jgi:hypothetical protein